MTEFKTLAELDSKVANLEGIVKNQDALLQTLLPAVEQIKDGTHPTLETLRTRAKALQVQMIEDAAVLCETFAFRVGGALHHTGAKECAALIRALKDKVVAP